MIHPSGQLLAESGEPFLDIWSYLDYLAVRAGDTGMAITGSHASRTREVTVPSWVRMETVLALHEQLLAEFGGSPGLRDEGLLASAMARPENLHAHGTPSPFELAGSYAFGLVKHHFVDGNKRIGFATAVLSLELNGARFKAGEVDAVVQTLALAAGDLDEAGYAAWIKARSRI